MGRLVEDIEGRHRKHLTISKWPLTRYLRVYRTAAPLRRRRDTSVALNASAVYPKYIFAGPLCNARPSAAWLKLKLRSVSSLK